jgi:serine/threonine-protein kinase
VSSDLEAIRQALAGSYRVEAELGHGGMAHVFRACRVADGAPVAVKVLRPELAMALGPDRFRREIGVLRTLSHPHILPLLEAGESGPHVYFTMPCATGESLRKRLDREGRLSVDQAQEVAEQIGSALDYAHARGVLHRDIKPENILSHDGRWVLCDFGVARAIEAATSERLSPSGIVVGTPTYMSPEQGAADQKLDGRADLYALGCVLYEILAGGPPFTGATPQAIMARHAKEHVPRLTVTRPDVPAHVEAALERALAKRPRDRHRSGAALARALSGA